MSPLENVVSDFRTKKSMQMFEKPDEVIQATHVLSGKPLLIWRIVQTIVWLVGLGIFLALIFFPEIGIHAFWNVLIPVAPALLVVSTGLWRNICPLASTALLPAHLQFSFKIKPTAKFQGVLNLIAVIALFLIVPLRHVILDTSGAATAIVLLIIAVIAFALGLIFDWKSGWCSGLCPVHPVEKFYGSKPLFTLPNAHCDQCAKCTSPCPDSSIGTHPLTNKATLSHRLAGAVLIGGFPGFIWGWFHITDYYGVEGWQHLQSIYGLPFAALAVTLSLYFLIKLVLPSLSNSKLISIFAAAAVSCYYWFRLPALFGFGVFPGDGMLVDLSGVLQILR